MKRLLLLVAFSPVILHAQITNQSKEKLSHDIRQQGMRFTENKGQVTDINGKMRPDILFTAHDGGVKLFITCSGIYYQFRRPFEKKGNESGNKKMLPKLAVDDVDSTQFYTVEMRLVGANTHPEMKKEGVSSDYQNYYLPNCSNGILGVKNYDRVVFKNVYSGIDWVLYIKDHMMEYDFVVHPGADVGKIKMKYAGAVKLCLTDGGNLEITTPLGKVQEHKPLAFAGNAEISSRFIVRNHEVGFDVDYLDKTAELRIDPAIEWATYYGGEEADVGHSCATDKSGNVYLGGTTYSTMGIASGGFQNTYRGSFGDAFLAKFNSSGDRLWATYYGGNNLNYQDDGNSCATDGSGNVYLAGATWAESGIAFNGFQNTKGGHYTTDAFLVKFDANGGRLWATYYGGSSFDHGYSCVTDASDNVYLAGSTSSATGIASGGFQNSYGGSSDAFLTKFNSSGSRLWATYYGGNGGDGGSSCATDSYGNVYLTGQTASVTGIASGGFQNITGGDRDAFLAKFSSSGDRLWATYYGGSGVDEGNSCAADVSGNIYLSGSTFSFDGIASGGFQNTYSGSYGDAFLVKFTSIGNRVWGTYYGGYDEDRGNSCITDSSGNVYLSGYTASGTGIASAGFQDAIGGGYDAFVVKFNGSCGRLWGSYYGGDGNDKGYSSAVDVSGNLYLAGQTGSPSGIAFGGFQNVIGAGYNDAFLNKVADCIASKPFIRSDKNTANVCPKDSVILSSSKASSYLWNTGEKKRSIIVKTPGSYAVTITDSNGCKNTSDTTTVTYQSCTKATGLGTGNITSTAARLSWSPDTCAVGYQYQWRVKGTAVWTSAQIAGSSKTITGLIPATTYQWRVIKACRIIPDTLTSLNYTNAPEFTTLSAAATTTKNTLWLMDRDAVSPGGRWSVAIVPNPTSSSSAISFSLPEQKLVSLKIFDLSGRLIQSITDAEFSAGAHKLMWDATNLKAGVYVLRMQAGNYAETKKLVVVK